MIKRNTMIILLYSFFNSFLLYRSCDVLYYLSKGILNSQYINYLTIGSLITIIFLIPFGIIKDKYNRKIILIISNLFLLVSVLFYIYSNTAFFMGIGIIMSSISNLLSQGIVVSILHSFTSDKNEYSKMYYKWSIYYFSGYLISMVLGGFVAKYSLVLMYYISLIPILINFIILFLFNDNFEKFKDNNSSKLLLKDSYKLIKNSKLLKILILSEIIIVPLGEILAESHPEYLANMGASTILIGIYTAVMCLFAIVGNKIASIQKNQMNNFFVFSFLYLISLIFIGFINNYFSILFIILFQCFYSVTNNIYNTIIQNECVEHCRQTVLAIFTFIISAFQMVICTITSLLFKKFEMGTSYIILGTISIPILLIIFFIYLKKSHKLKKIHLKS